MTAPDVVTTTRSEPRESGLDTSNGLEFVQQRIGLFAKIIALIGVAFMIVGAVGSLALQMTGLPGIPLPTRPMLGGVAHVVGLALLIWCGCCVGGGDSSSARWNGSTLCLSSGLALRGRSSSSLRSSSRFMEPWCRWR